MSNRIHAGSLALALLAGAAALFPQASLAEPPVKAQGREFPVNLFPVQLDRASVASDALGGFIVVWQGQATDTSPPGIFAQRFDDRGDMVEVFPFRIDVNPNSFFDDPVVAMDPTGAFVVAWESGEIGSGDSNIVARRFDRDGRPKDGNEFPVNAAAVAGQQTQPAVAVGPDGEIAIAWSSQSADGLNVQDIRVRRFAASGDPGRAALERVVTTDDSGDLALGAPVVAMSSGGRYVVVWDSDDRLLEDGDIRGRAFDGGGPVGAEFDAASAKADDQARPAIAINANGEYVVAWQDERTASGNGIFARRFSFPNQARGLQFLAQDSLQQSQFDPRVSIDARGRFVVVWRAVFGAPAVEGRMFRPNGRPFGREFRVSDSERSGATLEDHPRVALDADGDFVVVWNSFNPSDPIANQILVRRFRGPEEIDFQARIRGRLNEHVLRGAEIKYTATIANLHPREVLTGIEAIDSAIGTVRDPLLTVELPQRFRADRRFDFVPGDEGRCGRGINVIKCLPSRPLRSGETATLKFRLTPSQAGAFTAEVSVSSPSLDPDASNDTDASVINFPAQP